MPTIEPTTDSALTPTTDQAAKPTRGQALRPTVEPATDEVTNLTRNLIAERATGTIDAATTGPGLGHDSLRKAAPAPRLPRPDRFRLPRGLRAETGAATAEYAVATMAAVGFAGLLIVILRGDEVRGILTDLVRKALSVG